MTHQDCFQLGYVEKSHGIQGEIVIFLDTDNPGHYSKIKTLFLEYKGSLVPYLVEKIKIQSKKGIVKLLEIDSEEKAKNLKGKLVFLPLSDLPKLKKGDYFLHEVIGFQVEDKNHGKLGQIECYYNLPQQDLYGMAFNEKEVLIPVNPDIITEVNFENRVVKTNLPDGLLEVYLEEDQGPDAV